MNFLAHALLAAGNTEKVATAHDADDALIAGGVAGDWIKGPLDRSGLPEDFRRGVALHRAIDSFAETDPAFRASRARCRPEHRRWSGVLVDLYYDHLLARDWNDWNARPLPEFTARTYAALGRHLDACPTAARPALELMRDEDWLSCYATTEGLAEVLARMGRRVRRANPLADGLADLLEMNDAFTDDFRQFMRDAQAFSRQWQRDWPHVHRQ